MATGMKTSRKWLQNFFAEALPSTEALSDALTFHVFEIEQTEKKGEDDVLEVNILPDRAAYGLSHRGVAYELSAILGLPMKADPLRAELPPYPQASDLQVQIEKSDKCLRYMGAVMHGVRVEPSPVWLKEALEAVGQRSIKNVVDATNYVMLNIGQPLHAFAAGKLTQKDGKYAIAVRGAYEGEKITTLTGEEYVLPEDTLIIADANADAPIGIAGVKGGQRAAITEDTTDIILESANFDGTSVRRASQTLKLWTDASLRFQNRPSPELSAYGLRDVIDLIKEIAGGEVTGVVDEYPGKETTDNSSVTISRTEINNHLGSSYSLEQVIEVFNRLGFSYTSEDETFTVTAPYERRDIVIPEDIAEEVGRIIGYDSVPATRLPPLTSTPDQARYRGIERIKDVLIEHGYTELSTQSFAKEGEVYLANPLDQTKPALRPNLTENMEAALTRAVSVAPRVVGPATSLKLFDVGMVFKKDGEHLSLAIGYVPLTGKKQPVLTEITDVLTDLIPGIAFTATDTVLETNLDLLDLSKLGENYTPEKVELGPYHPFSIYPFALRDIAVWTPAGTQESDVEGIILTEAGELLVRIDQFDRFEKKNAEGETERISYAFRLVFESMERTLSDEDLYPVMERVTNALNAREGFEVR